MTTHQIKFYLKPNPDPMLFWYGFPVLDALGLYDLLYTDLQPDKSEDYIQQVILDDCPYSAFHLNFNDILNNGIHVHSLSAVHINDHKEEVLGEIKFMVHNSWDSSPFIYSPSPKNSNEYSQMGSLYTYPLNQNTFKKIISFNPLSIGLIHLHSCYFTELTLNFCI